MVMRKPLGSTHQGAGEWLVQRLTSLYLAAFAVFLALRLGANPVPDYASWVAFWRGPVIRIFWLLFWVSLCAHAWIGMRSVWMDYAKPIAVRFALQTLTAFGLLALVLSALRLVW
jgi:succinate dehydrogenase / fumarate reductase membrane anchor subunit